MLALPGPIEVPQDPAARRPGWRQGHALRAPCSERPAPTPATWRSIEDDAEKVRMQKSSAVAGIDWATELHAVCVTGNDGRMIERFDVTHDSQALHVVVVP